MYRAGREGPWLPVVERGSPWKGGEARILGWGIVVGSEGGIDCGRKGSLTVEMRYKWWTWSGNHTYSCFESKCSNEGGDLGLCAER